MTLEGPDVDTTKTSPSFERSASKAWLGEKRQHYIILTNYIFTSRIHPIHFRYDIYICITFRFTI